MSSYTSITTNNLNSNSNNDFSSINNKKKIWSIMKDIGLFDNVDKNYATFIQNDFDKQIAIINNNKKPKDTVIELNKKTITVMMNELNKYNNNVKPSIQKDKISNTN